VSTESGQDPREAWWAAPGRGVRNVAGRPSRSFDVMRTGAIAVIVLFLIAASIVALAAMIHGAGKFEWNGFYPWVIGPYLVLLGIFCLPRRQSRARAFAGCLAAAMVLVFTCWFYVGAMWFSASSTSALIFIFAPAYLFVGGLVAWGITWFLGARIYGTT
jgi:hypothetical protein